MFEGKLKKIIDRFEFLEKEMQGQLDRNKLEEYSKEYSDLRDVREVILKFFSIVEEIEDTSMLLKDKEFAGLAESELLTLKSKKESIEQDLKLLLIPKDINDERSVIIEIRAGTGGDEASLFALDLYKMYQRFADKNNCKGKLSFYNVVLFSNNLQQDIKSPFLGVVCKNNILFTDIDEVNYGTLISNIKFNIPLELSLIHI